jgi:hypothetical protein
MSVRRGSNGIQQYVLHDADIRASLINHLRELYSNDPNTRILQEFGLCEGTVRIDVAVVNGLLIGYEIKSDSDTLERLPIQQEIYSQIFNRIVVVVGTPHTFKVARLVPQWWGIWQSITSSGEVIFEVIREPQQNPNINPLSLVKCLWRDEALGILKDNGLADGLEKAKRSIIREKLATALSCDELNLVVCNHLKARVNWNIVLKQE